MGQFIAAPVDPSLVRQAPSAHDSAAWHWKAPRSVRWLVKSGLHGDRVVSLVFDDHPGALIGYHPCITSSPSSLIRYSMDIGLSINAQIGRFLYPPPTYGSHKSDLRQVTDRGAEIVGEIYTYNYWRCGWFIDPVGQKVELWEPAASTNCPGSRFDKHLGVLFS